MAINDIPVVSFFKRLLDPFIIWGMLVFLTILFNERFTGYYLVLMIISYFISSYVFEQVLIYGRWRTGNLLNYIRDTILGWGIVVAILILIGYASKLSYRFSEQVILTWFIVTPLALISSHIAVHLIADHLRINGGLRSAVIVGDNNTSLRLIQRIKEFPYLLIDIRGYLTRVIPVGYTTALGRCWVTFRMLPAMPAITTSR